MMRHADSEESGEGRDHDRPITEAGRADCSSRFVIADPALDQLSLLLVHAIALWPAAFICTLSANSTCVQCQSASCRAGSAASCISSLSTNRRQAMISLPSIPVVAEIVDPAGAGRRSRSSWRRGVGCRTSSCAPTPRAPSRHCRACGCASGIQPRSLRGFVAHLDLCNALSHFTLYLWLNLYCMPGSSLHACSSCSRARAVESLPHTCFEGTRNDRMALRSAAGGCQRLHERAHAVPRRPVHHRRLGRPHSGLPGGALSGV